MTTVKAKLNNYRQSPRKVRLVANLIRGKRVERAMQELRFVNKKATRAVKKLLESAVANAKNNNGLKEKDLVLKEIRVDNGSTMKRFRAGARGQAYPLKRRTSHISIALESVKDSVNQEKKSNLSKKSKDSSEELELKK